MKIRVQQDGEGEVWSRQVRNLAAEGYVRFYVRPRLTRFDQDEVIKRRLLK